MAQRAVARLQLAAFLTWMVLVVSPAELPDPLGLGLSYSLTALCLLASAIIWAPDLLAGRWPSTAIDPVLALYLVFVAIASTTTIVPNPHNTSVAVLSLAGNVGMFYATVVIARRAPDLAHGILLLLIASIALLMAMALAYHVEMGLSTRPKEYSVPEGWGGYPELGMLAALQFGLLVAALQTTGSKAMFVVTALLILVNLFELTLLYSRGAWLAVGVVMLAAVGVTARRGQWARTAGIAGMVAVAGLVLFLSNPTLRYLTMTTVTGGTAPAWVRDGAVAEVAAPDSRIQIWERSVEMIFDHPMRGVGPGDFEEVFQANYVSDPNEDLRRAGVHAHNLWLHQFAELGLAGGAVYVALWVAVLGLGWKSARAQPGFLSLGLFLAIVAAAGSNLSTHMFFLTSGGVGRLHSLTWMLFGLAMATTERAAPSATSETAVGPRFMRWGARRS